MVVEIRASVNLQTLPCTSSLSFLGPERPWTPYHSSLSCGSFSCIQDSVPKFHENTLSKATLPSRHGFLMGQENLREGAGARPPLGGGTLDGDPISTQPFMCFHVLFPLEI